MRPDPAATPDAVGPGVSPAFAEGAGVTIGGSSTITAAAGGSVPPFCNKTTANPTITLKNVGTVAAEQTAPTPSAAVYAGLSTATFNLPVFYFGPQGTYATNTCTSPLAPPTAVTLAAGGGLQGSLTVGGVTESASCTWTGGKYIRVAEAYKIQVTGNCVVSDGIISAAQVSTFVFEGNQNPCLDGFAPPVGPDPTMGMGIPNCELVSQTDPVENEIVGTEFQGTYAQVPGSGYPNLP